MNKEDKKQIADKIENVTAELNRTVQQLNAYRKESQNLEVQIVKLQGKLEALNELAKDLEK